MKKQNAGNSIIVTMGTIAIVSVLVASAIEFTSGIGRNAKRSRTLNEAIAIGDGALEMAFSSWRQISRVTPTQILPTSSFDTEISLPTAADFPLITNFTATRGVSDSAFTVSNYAVEAVNPQLQALSDINTAPTAGAGMNTDTNSYFYLASADVSLPTVNGTLTARVRRVFQKESTSLWNKAIFYNDVLEIHPGPPFTVTGPVHTNGALYCGNNTLTFGSEVTFGNSYTTGWAPGDSYHTAVPASPTFNPSFPATQTQREDPFGISPAQFNTGDANPNNDSYRELIERPDAAQTDAFAGTRYYDDASVKILVDNAGAFTILNSAGVVVTATSPAQADRNLYNAVRPALTTGQNIRDNREAATVRLTTLDISLINTNQISNFNGVVYISDTSAGQTGGAPKRGIRLRNGATLPNAGLTVASDNPVYIQGDYNTGTNGGNQPPSNSGTPTQPTVNGYTRKSSAVIGDAVTILSNAWVDANSTLGLNSRVATNTTVNTAILSGIVPTAAGPNSYSGGAENFPRFMERWSGGRTITYYGSMVQLFNSQQGIGRWGQANVYAAPTRNWYFDTNFRTNPPPGPLVSTQYVKQQWFLE